MAGVRPLGSGNGIPGQMVYPGDILLLGESYSAGADATVGASTLTGAMIATGLIARTGSTAGYTDTTDTATNIIAALAGNQPTAEAVQGTSFRCRILNTVAFALTLAAGVGVVLGSGTLNVAASTWRDLLFTVLNAGPNYTVNAATTTANATVLFNLPPGLVAYKIGPAPDAINISPGMTISGTGVTAGTTVLSTIMGQGGIIGIVMSAVGASIQANTALTFGPTVRVDGIGSGTL